MRRKYLKQMAALYANEEKGQPGLDLQAIARARYEDADDFRLVEQMSKWQVSR